MTFRSVTLAVLTTASTLSAQATRVEGERIQGYRSSISGGQAATLNQKDREGSRWFDQFTAGINAFGGANGGAGVEMGTLARIFRLTLKEEEVEVPAPTALDPGRKAVVSRKKYLYFALLNRASINLDSLKNLAADYVSSLQPSPFTARLYGDIQLTNRKTMKTKVKYPDVRLVLQADARAVPFGNAGGDVGVGATGHAFGTLKIGIKTDELDTGGNTVDTGLFYVEPSFYWAKATSRLAMTLFDDGKEHPLEGVEVRIGYKSEKDQTRDLGVLLQYTWQEIVAPNFRIGLNLTK